MRKLVMGFALAGIITLLPRSEAQLPPPPGATPLIFQGMLKGEVGLASWYGNERQGKETASGELFDKNRLTAAHMKLRLGTKVQVTNLTNLKSVQVRINDRGPGVSGRVIDVSWAAAKKLGFVGEGLSPVVIQVVSYPQWYLRQAMGPILPRSPDVEAR